MIARLHHRGPDGSGFFVKTAMGLAQARLSIIDLAGGQQPIQNEDGTVQAVFNGEFFDYVELRRDLIARGHCFYTQSDTKVIVRLYEEHGERFVNCLNGQFAIALWDTRRQSLLLARDRTGIRPFFYTESAERLIFASEVKALFALPGVRRIIDVQALAETCTYWSLLAPRTAFEGVLSLPLGHLMIVADGVRSMRRYWDGTFPDTEPRRNSEANHAEANYTAELRELLIDAVRLQLCTDVPVGAYLSGGLDSSIVTSIIRNSSGTPLRTFSLNFENAEFDESVYQKELVDYLGAEHTSICGTRAFFRDGMEHACQPYFAHIPRRTTTRRIGQFFSRQVRDAVGDWNPYDAILATLPSGMNRWKPIARDQYVEAHMLMTGYLFCSQGDRVAMANSIEGRFSFLDHRLMEFANRLRPKLKLHGLTQKHPLKKSMAGLFPEAMRRRTKWPYRVLDSQNFFNAGRPQRKSRPQGTLMLVRRPNCLRSVARAAPSDSQITWRSLQFCPRCCCTNNSSSVTT